MTLRKVDRIALGETISAIKELDWVIAYCVGIKGKCCDIFLGQRLKENQMMSDVFERVARVPNCDPNWLGVCWSLMLVDFSGRFGGGWVEGLCK